MNLDSEPVRIPLWISLVLILVLQVALALVSGADWRAEVASAIGTVLLILGGIEKARSIAFSPKTVTSLTRSKGVTILPKGTMEE